MTNSSYDSSASALIKTLNWPTVADMIKVETACMVYKSINTLRQTICQKFLRKARHAVGKILETPQLISRYL